MALDQYVKRPRVTKIPWGYFEDPDDPKMMIPMMELFEILDETFNQLDSGIPIRHAYDWYRKRCEEIEQKPLSHMGVFKLWNFYRPDHPRKQVRVRPKRQTREQRSKSLKTKKLMSERISFAAAKKRIEKLQDELAAKKRKPKEEPPAPVEDSPVFDVSEIKEEYDIVFEPNPGPQYEFLAAEEQEVLYGGAAGGGKSYAMLADPMRYFDNPNFNGILLRRTNDELRELIWKSQDLYPKAFPGAKWSEKRSSWTLPAGGHMWFTYLERDEDVRRYQGQAFCWIGFDELAQYPTPFAWNYLRSRLRSVDPNLPLTMRATSNPGGPGHGWVKRMFVDPAPYNTSFVARDLDTDEELRYPKGHPREGEVLFYRRFIPARVSDNPYLWEDGAYEANLLSLPENQRRQLLDGDWNIADGAAFPEFRYGVHVCKPFEIDPNWRRFRSCDYGYASHTAVHWYAIDPIYGTLYVYRELYTSRKTGVELGYLIQQQEADEDISYGVLDHATWQVRGQTGPSVAEEILGTGCRFRPTDANIKSRAHGFQKFHEALQVDRDTGLPGIIFFDRCRQIISDLPVIPVDPDGKDDIDQDYRSDHAYDSVRYGIMSRPKNIGVFDINATPKMAYKPANSLFGY